VDLGVCILLLRFPWERLELYREKCGDKFRGVGPRGYLETFEGKWNFWSHNAMRILGRPMMEPWKGSGVA
jgi:hypothetical protein